ncbi:MAG: helicase HerA domain-containing protein, partial [Nitrosopumilus sp.]
MKSISILSKGKKNNKQNNKLSDQQFKYSYSIIPTNFINLSEKHQAQKLGQFNDILRVIEDRIKITMSRRLVAITVEGQITEMPVMQVHLESHQPLGDILDQIKLEYISGDRPPKNKIIKENLSNLEIQNNDITNFTQCFTLHGLPASLPYAWITNIFQLCSQIQILINPVPKDESITRMVRFKNIIYEDSKKDRSTAELYKRADDTENSLRRDDTGLYECIVNCVITAPDKKTLHANSKLFKKQIKRHGGSFAAVSAKQAVMLLEGYGKKLTLDRGSCSILYSFVSADMLEIPNGIPLGINMISKGPVIFDIGKRTNYNIAVIGKSGSGKSFTVKILLNRLHQKFPDSHIYVIDPMGEYGTISKFFGMNHLNITKNDEQLGLDPFILLELQDAADILSEMTNAPDTTKIQFQKYCDKVNN